MSASVALTAEKAQELLRGITLPPQPATLLEIKKEQAKAEPDLAAVADAIAKDITVSAGVLKTLNSPFFGMRRTVDSIPKAVHMLGLQNVVNIVASLSLRQAMRATDNPGLARFFDIATDTASVAAALARELRIMPADKAYMLGLFHDCGVPLMMQKFPGYTEALRGAGDTPERVLTDVEEELFDTNHAVVGYYVSLSWGLPRDISEAILNHHRVKDLLAADEQGGESKVHAELTSVVSLLTMAEYIAYDFCQSQDTSGWDAVSERVLKRFDLSAVEFGHLKDDIFAKLGS